MQAHAYDYPADFFEQREWRVERRVPDPQRIAEAVRLLNAAERPMIIAGGGIHYSEASEALEDFAAKFGIPVSETFAGKGAIRNASPLLLGGQGRQWHTCRSQSLEPIRFGYQRRLPHDGFCYRLSISVQSTRR